MLDRSVELFGKNRVFSNVIIGLGETDAEMETCINKLTSHGVIPVLRPLNPVAGFTGTPRPSAKRLKTLYTMHARAIAAAGLDPFGALTMCTNCAGCDLVPGEGRMKGVEALLKRSVPVPTGGTRFRASR